MTVPTAEADLAAGFLWGSGVAGVGEHPLAGGSTRLECDVPPGGIDAVVAALGGRWPVEVATVDDGLDGWRAWAAPVRAGSHLVVHPPWVAAPEREAGDVVLEIDPGRSFGHGAHPTTRLVLAEVERLAGPGRSVLDVGCGSGVLAIAAARLGAAPVVAVDIDPEALAATRANAAANGVDIEVGPGPLAEVAGRFDLVLANIGAATLAVLSGELAARTAAGGRLVLSGLLAGRWEPTVAAFPGCTVERHDELDGWVSVTLDPARAAERPETGS